MISKDYFTKEHIEALRSKNNNDPSLLEKSVFAFGLVIVYPGTAIITMKTLKTIDSFQSILSGIIGIFQSAFLLTAYDILVCL